jgi:hypothetical protein
MLPTIDFADPIIALKLNSNVFLSIAGEFIRPKIPNRKLLNNKKITCHKILIINVLEGV